MNRGFRRREFLTAVPGLICLPRVAWTRDGLALADTASGKVRGAFAEGVEIYRGIPYAGSVSGANRFKGPQPVKAWSRVRDATVPGPPSIQPPNQTFGLNEPAPAEDCLTLTVWTPARDGRRRPVMVYSHGGGFTTGSAASVIQDGANLARLYDVVVVATNHRLGLLGYLYLDELGGEEYRGSGNNGMRDIVAGLEWVSRNIEYFGGDPRNVMVFGESGGGAKTSCLYAMPTAANFFNKASIESGPGIRMTPVEDASRTTDAVLAELGISRVSWRKLLDVPVSRLLEVQMKLAGPGGAAPPRGGKAGLAFARIGFAPVVDGKVLPSHPFDPHAPAISKDKPLIVGYNHDEFAFFAFMTGDKDAFTLDEAGLRTRLSSELPADYEKAIAVYRESRPGISPGDLYIAIRSALFAGTGSVVIAERKVAQRAAPAYAYVFNYQLETPMPGTQHPLGAMHALEIPFKFDNVKDVPMKAFGNFAGQRPDRLKAGRAMSEMWATFARTGNPAAKGQPSWPAYSLERRSTMIIDANCRVEDDPHSAERRFWEQRKES